ncbi:MAG TPA: hypothetical protein VGN26_09850 [Armatimonadota bacterium]|jgi:uncharacterized protein YrrD
MRRIDSCLGVRLTALDTGADLGMVCRVVTDPLEGRVLAFVAPGPHWYSEHVAVPFSDVLVLGSEALIVASAGAVRPITQLPQLLPHLEYVEVKRQRKALSSLGVDLGTVTEWSFDEGSAEVLQYELQPSTGGPSLRVPSSVFTAAGAAIVILDVAALEEAGLASPAQDGTDPRAAWEGVPRPEVPLPPAAAPDSFVACTPAPPWIPLELRDAPPEQAPPPSLPARSLAHQASLPADLPPEPLADPAPRAEVEPTPEAEPAQPAEADLLPPTLEMPVPSEAGLLAAPDAPKAPLLSLDEPSASPAVADPESAAPSELDPAQAPDAADDPCAPDLAAMDEEAETVLYSSNGGSEPTNGVAKEPAIELPVELPQAPPPAPEAEQEDQVLRLVLGRRADREILDDQGARIVAPGEEITPEVARAARQAWKLYELLASAEV